jgi:cytochrome b561
MMHFKNTITEYGLISKFFHWFSAILLFTQIPLGYYLVDLDFGQKRIDIENIHVIIGLMIFYLIIFRLIYKTINPTPVLKSNLFWGQNFLAKSNHVLLYIGILLITVSGVLKKLFNGEEVTIFLYNFEIEDNFELGELFFNIHVYSNYLIISLITVHILAVVIHKLFFNENLLKRIL